MKSLIRILFTIIIGLFFSACQATDDEVDFIKKTFTFKKVNDLDFDAPQEIRDVAGDNQLFGVRFGLGETAVDDRYTPAEGHVVNAEYEQVSGDFTFGILEGSYVHYFTLHEDVLGRKTVLAAKVRALLDGRYNIAFEDVNAVAHHALRHRMILNFEGEAEGIDADDIIDTVLEEVKSANAAKSD